MYIFDETTSVVLYFFSHYIFLEPALASINQRNEAYKKKEREMAARMFGGK
jgi:hypothetical protein